MKLTNLAPWDRVLRCVTGVAMLALGWSGTVGGLGGAALQLFGWFPLVTGLIGWSPIYSMFGFSTRAPVSGAPTGPPPSGGVADEAEDDDRLSSRGP